MTGKIKLLFPQNPEKHDFISREEKYNSDYTGFIDSAFPGKYESYELPLKIENNNE